jgi:hypothetical protein
MLRWLLGKHRSYTQKGLSIFFIWHNGLKFLLKEHSCFYEILKYIPKTKKGFMMTFALFERHVMQIEENVDSGKYIDLIPLCANGYCFSTENILDPTHSIC